MLMIKRRNEYWYILDVSDEDVTVIEHKVSGNINKPNARQSIHIRPNLVS